MKAKRFNLYIVLRNDMKATIPESRGVNAQKRICLKSFKQQKNILSFGKNMI